MSVNAYLNFWKAVQGCEVRMSVTIFPSPKPKRTLFRQSKLGVWQGSLQAVGTLLKLLDECQQQAGWRFENLQFADKTVDPEERRYVRYYQWVCFCLFFQVKNFISITRHLEIYRSPHLKPKVFWLKVAEFFLLLIKTRATLGKVWKLLIFEGNPSNWLHFCRQLAEQQVPHPPSRYWSAKRK